MQVHTYRDRQCKKRSKEATMKQVERVNNVLQLKTAGGLGKANLWKQEQVGYGERWVGAVRLAASKFCVSQSYILA
jgi:hypothetical protein